jgi:drug/metabolite transporter (DMT)-like permease
MLKRFFEVLGLIAMGAGVYFVVSEHSKQNVCNATEGKYVGFGMSPQCQHVVYAYFGGFILLAAGALVVVFGLLATRRASNHRNASKNPSLASQYHYVDPKNARPPES